MKTIELSFVIPAFNEEKSIHDALYTLDQVVKETGLHYEVVVVNDGSVDETMSRAMNYANNNGHVKVVGYHRNLGKGHAIKTGFVETTGEAVVFVDSDLEIDFAKVTRYIEALRHGDIAIASKWHPESVIEIPLIRKLLGLGFNVLVRLLVGVKFKDTQTGLKAIRRVALAKVLPGLAVKRYAFDVELLAVASLYGLEVVELPVKVKMRRLFNPIDVWRMFIDVLGIAYRLRVLRWYQRAKIETFCVH